MAEGSGDPARRHLSREASHGGGGAETASSEAEISWERLSHWLCCMCVVTFDLELGQAMETLIPSNYTLSDVEKTNICYLAFPDSNSGCMGDTQFHFRVRCSGPGAGGCGLRHGGDHYGAPLVLMPDSSHYYGFVYFRQVKDADIRRGYFQKSVVLLTRLPYITFFSQVVQKIAPEYFTNGLPSLEAACYNMNQWAGPRPGHILQLPLLGQLIQVRLPTKGDKPGVAHGSDMEPTRRSSVMVIPSVHDLNLYQALSPLLSNFELLWELVITNQPIAVMASSPTLCADAVQALVSIIHPLKYAGDYRPFFTIHDSEFKHYTTRTQAPPQVILGVTNPFFAKTLEHWPHLVRIGEQSSLEESSLSRSRSPSETSRLKPGLHTKHKALLQRDKAFARMVASVKSAPGKRPMEVQNVMIKKHALELTTSFIIPLERYLASLMPLKREVSPWRPPPQLKAFQVEQFLKGMEGTGPHLTSGIKGNWAGLYRRFLSSENFCSWYCVRREEANQKLRLLHLDMLCKADINFWMRGKHEVEIVDFLIQVKDCVTTALLHYPSVHPQTLSVLQSQVRAVIGQLPADLQSCLRPAFMAPPS